MEIIISKSTNKNKKFDAFVDGKKISFGQHGASDFSIHKDPERKDRYIARHAKREDWDKSGVKTAGFYSRWVLWHMPTIESSIADLNKKYKDIKFKYVK